MNQIITIIKLNTDEQTKKAITNIISHLEKHNFAIVENVNAIREFNKNLPSFYKEKDIIIISETLKQKNKPKRKIITVNSEYLVEKSGSFGFRIKTKNFEI